MFAQNKLRNGVFAETADIGVEQIGQGGAADEIRGGIAAGSAQPAVGVPADGVGTGGGQELERAHFIGMASANQVTPVYLENRGHKNWHSPLVEGTIIFLIHACINNVLYWA